MLTQIFLYNLDSSAHKFLEVSCFVIVRSVYKIAAWCRVAEAPAPDSLVVASCYHVVSCRCALEHRIEQSRHQNFPARVRRVKRLLQDLVPVLRRLEHFLIRILYKFELVRRNHRLCLLHIPCKKSGIGLLLLWPVKRVSDLWLPVKAWVGASKFWRLLRLIISCTDEILDIASLKIEKRNFIVGSSRSYHSHWALGVRSVEGHHWGHGFERSHRIYWVLLAMAVHWRKLVESQVEKHYAASGTSIHNLIGVLAQGSTGDDAFVEGKEVFIFVSCHPTPHIVDVHRSSIGRVHKDILVGNW